MKRTVSSQLLDYALASIAVFRGSRMLIKEPGPGAVLDKVRDWAGPKSDEEVRGSLRQGMTCPFCNSIWLGFVTSVFYAATGRIGWLRVPFYTFALSGGALLIRAQWKLEWAEITKLGEVGAEEQPKHPVNSRLDTLNGRRNFTGVH